MSNTEEDIKENQSIWRRIVSKRWRWLFGTTAAIMGIVLIVAIIDWAGSAQVAPGSVAQQWNEAIQRLGFEPVYPPIEDIAVGDVLAIIVEDAAQDINGEPFAGRSIKLEHLDLTQEIEKAYREIYQFPDTAERPQDGKPWPQSPAKESLFKPPVLRGALPLVVFPGFTITRTKRGGVNASGLTNLWQGTFGTTADSTETIEVKIPAAETYGVPALPAELRLMAFCTDPKTELLCSDAGVRQQLSIVAGAKIHDLIKDKTSGKEKSRFTVEMALINRVFLARAIETRIRRDSRRDADLRVDSAAPSPPVPDAKGPSGNPAATALATSAAKVAPEPGKPVSRGDGASASIQDTSSSDLVLPPTVLQRPVVIGFKSVRWQTKERGE